MPVEKKMNETMDKRGLNFAFCKVVKKLIMCDHCAKITSQKGYAGQVTCRCEQGEKKNGVVGKEKDFAGCCSKKEKKIYGGCCGAKCCSGTKEEHGGCCSDATTDQKSCCPAGKAREAAGGCCMSGCCKQTKNGKNERDLAGTDCTIQAKDTVRGCCAENRK